MNYFEIVLLTLAISFGVFKMLSEAGVEYCFTSGERFRIAMVFAVFKGILMLLGFWITGLFQQWLTGSGHIVIIAIFLVLGLKIIFESIKLKPGERTYDLNNSVILVLAALAANTDGFIAGIAFAFSGVEAVNIAALLFGFTFLVSWSGLYYGKKKGKTPQFSRPGIAGGLLLLGYALFLLLERTGSII